tara:strand:- start:362 stop:886 length:525 start_codon:yes stop_codon:yes gene_type:complete
VIEMNNNLHINEMMSEEQATEWYAQHELDGEAVVQLRINAGGLLHVQVYLPEQMVNRPYGYADKFIVPSEVTAWLATHDGEYLSFASPERLYIRPLVQIARFKDGVQLLINVTKAFIDSQVWDEVNAPNCESFIMDIDLTKEKNLQFIEAMEFAGLVWAEDKERLVPFTGGEEE